MSAHIGDSRRLSALTALRGMAALAVFCLHAWSLCGRVDPAPAWPWLSALLRWLFGIGWVGVDVFFTLSGFLLALPFFRDHSALPQARTFFLRRWLRIFPAYYAQLLVLWLLVPQIPALANTLRNIPEGLSLAAHGLLWFYAWPVVTPWLSVWWTLPVEFGFYLCLPGLLVLIKRGHWHWLLALLCVSWLWRWGWLTAGDPGLLTVYRVDHVPGRIGQFLIGMLAAWAWTQHAGFRALIVNKAPWWFALSLVLLLAWPAAWLLVNPTAHDWPSAQPLLIAWHDLASAIVAVLLLSMIALRGIAARVLQSPLLQGLGTVSFGLYLWHFPVLYALRTWLLPTGAVYPDFWSYWWLSLLVSLALATLSYQLIERPCWRLGRSPTNALGATAGKLAK